MHTFVFIVNSVVKHILSLKNENPVGEKWIAALRSSVLFKEATKYGIAAGDIVIDNNFYRKTEDGRVLIEQDLDISPDDTVRFAGIIDDEVVGMMIISKQPLGEDNFNRVVECFSSNPLIIEIDNEPVDIGWSWNGQTFSPPV